MSIFSVNQSAARTKQTHRPEVVTRDEVVDSMRAQMYGVPAAAQANLIPGINTLLTLTAATDAMVKSDDSDDDGGDSIDVARMNVAKWLRKHAKKFEKREKPLQGMGKFIGIGAGAVVGKDGQVEGLGGLVQVEE